LTTKQLQQQLDSLKDVKPRKPPQGQKRKRDVEQCWSRRVCFIDLLYRTSFELLHNLDVTRIDKNICENLIRILLITARIYLEEIGIRPHLYMKKTEGES